MDHKDSLVPDSDDPFVLFQAFYDEAVATGMDDPNAMVLATVDSNGQPSARVVLLKSFDARGFVFYTNLESRKGMELAAQPRVGLNFFWRQLGKQVRISGVAEPVSEAEADAYFATRPRPSRMGAWASRQSRPLAKRDDLLRELKAQEERFAGRQVSRPPHWSGFRVVPTEIELWVAGEFRLHDRVVFRRAGERWQQQRLYP